MAGAAPLTAAVLASNGLTLTLQWTASAPWGAVTTGPELPAVNGADAALVQISAALTVLTATFTCLAPFASGVAITAFGLPVGWASDGSKQTAAVTNTVITNNSMHGLFARGRSRGRYRGRI
jgi:hypothetical protein